MHHAVEHCGCHRHLAFVAFTLGFRMNQAGQEIQLRAGKNGCQFFGDG